MYSRKISWLVTIFFTILLFGIGFRGWITLVSLLPICFTLISYFITNPSEKSELKISREIEQARFQEGEHIEVKLHIKNLGKKKIDMVEVIDKLPRQVSLRKGSNHVITSLDREEETTVKYVIRCDYRGRWEMGPTKVRMRNFLNSAFVTQSYEETKTKFVVIPNFEIINDMPFRTKFPKISDGPFHSKLKGEGLDFSGVREYQSSDSLGRINWLATAKYGKLFSNEYELFRSADLLLILDATEKTASILDYQIQSVLSLAEYFIKFKCRVGLIIVRDTVDSFELSSSRQQLLKFTEKLVDVQPTRVESYSLLQKRVKANLAYFPSNCLTIVFSPLVHPVMNKIIINLMKLRTNSLILSPSLIDFEWKYVNKKDAPMLLIHQNLLLRRKTQVAKVVQSGAFVLEWDTKVPFSVFMNKLKQVAIRRGRR